MCSILIFFNQLILFALCLLLLATVVPSLDVNSIEREVLEANEVGREFEFDLTNNSSCNKSRVKYLGIIETTENVKIKLLNKFMVIGSGCKGVSRLCVYNMNNQYLGNYKLDMPQELPDTIINHSIVYLRNTENDISRKGISNSFQSGIRKSIETCGGLYVFE